MEVKEYDIVPYNEKLGNIHLEERKKKKGEKEGKKKKQ